MSANSKTAAFVARWFTRPTFLPVLDRELREHSHRAFNYVLRAFAAALTMSFLWVLIQNLERSMGAASMGIVLFTSLHSVLLVLIISIVPTMTADCISSEKRNGTLGLLFLTPLTPAGITIGKSSAHAFRAFTLWLSVLPILVIPFLLGGITWLDVLSAVTIEFCAILLCLSAGLLASAFSKARNKSLFIAFWLAAILILAFALQLAFTFSAQTLPTRIALPRGGISRPFVIHRDLSTSTWLCMTGLYPTSFRAGSLGGWAALTSFRGLPKTWTFLLAQGATASMLILLLSIFIASWRIKLSWQDKTTRIPAKWTNLFCTPVFKNLFRSQMRRLLAGNPISWLQQYSWRARLTKWGLCLIFLLVECLGLAYSVEAGSILGTLTSIHVSLLFIAAMMFVFVGVSSFQQEKQTGALELILITPLRVNQIIFGRVYGLWKQFLPAFVLIAACHIASTMVIYRPYYYYQDTSDEGTWVTYCALAFGYLTLPIFATYFALRVKNLIAAGILTAITTLVAPFFGIMLLLTYDNFIVSHYNVTHGWAPVAFAILFGNVTFAAITVFLLHHSLSRRIYSF